MCVALHREAAARGCEAFRERRARKTYLAVVEGAVDAEGVPRREEDPEGWGEGKDGAGGRKRRPDSVQHTPAHGFFQRKKVGGEGLGCFSLFSTLISVPCSLRVGLFRVALPSNIADGVV